MMNQEDFHKYQYLFQSADNTVLLALIPKRATLVFQTYKFYLNATVAKM